MKKISFITAIILATLMASSCSTVKYRMTPLAKNTVKSVSFEELNLTSNDYSVLDRVEATATVIAEIKNNTITLSDKENTFEIVYLFTVNGGLLLSSTKGIICSGYLAREDGSVDMSSPEDVAKRLAIYRLINLVREQGGDGIIEPLISTNVEGGGEDAKFGRSYYNIIYQTTVSGKIVKLKTTK